MSLYYLRARYYDPATAQFISRDPAVASTREPYAYTNDNPLNTTDPSGLCGAVMWVLSPQLCFVEAAAPMIKHTPLARPIGDLSNHWAGWTGQEHDALLSGNLSRVGCAVGNVLGTEMNISSGSLDPYDFWGATPGEADQMIPKGWRTGPTRGAGGARWANPATKGSEQFRYQPGNPGDPNPLKQGPYFRYSSGAGDEWGPIPAAGNPLE